MTPTTHDKPWLATLELGSVDEHPERTPDRDARRIVACAYGRAAADPERAPVAFDEAVAAYCRHFPHVPRRAATQAVAELLAHHDDDALTGRVGGDRPA